MQVGQFRDLGRTPRAALALFGCGMAGVPHEVIGDELPTALERIEAGSAVRRGPVSSSRASTSTIGRRLRAAAIASDSLVCDFLSSPQPIELRLELGSIDGGGQWWLG